MMVNVPSGLGAYPTDSYYDPNRPSWIPYWWDTPTESAMKYGAYPEATAIYKHPEVVAPIQAPPPPGSPTGPALTQAPASGEDAQATIDQILADQMAAWQAQNEATMAQTQANTQNQVKKDNTGTLLGIPYWMWLAGGVALVVLKR